MKATNKGTCQCCGSVQKLPSGVLSNHGYTVEFGWFNGTCQGAKHLPFEQSKELVEGFIGQAKSRLVAIVEEIESTRLSTASDLVWYQGYRPATWGRKGGYFWRQAELREEVSVRPTYTSRTYYIVHTEEEMEQNSRLKNQPSEAGTYSTNSMEDETESGNGKIY